MKTNSTTPLIGLEDLQFTSRDARISPAQVRRRGLVKLRRGCYLEGNAVPEGAERWVVRKLVTQARAVATVTAAASGAALTMDASLAVRGIDTWGNTTDIDYWPVGAGKNSVRTSLAQVQVRGIQVPPARTIPHRASRSGTTTELIRGIPTVPLAETILDLARFAHPLRAWVGITMAMRDMTCFDRRFLDESFARVETLRGELLTELQQFREERGYKRARAVVRGVDCGAESVGEAALLWILTILLRENTDLRAQFQSQVEVHFQGRNYFMDVGFPNLPFRIEFDGVEKLTLDRGMAREFTRREHILNNLGWDSLALGFDSLRDVHGLARMLVADLERRGVKTKTLGGPLWMPIPARLVDPLYLH